MPKQTVLNRKLKAALVEILAGKTPDREAIAALANGGWTTTAGKLTPTGRDQAIAARETLLDARARNAQEEA